MNLPWVPPTNAKIAMDRLTMSGHASKFADHMECYDGAAHGIGAPGFPTTISQDIQHPVTKQWLALGGNPKGIAHAARDAFEKKKAFLAKALPH